MSLFESLSVVQKTRFHIVCCTLLSDFGILEDMNFPINHYAMWLALRDKINDIAGLLHRRVTRANVDRLSTEVEELWQQALEWWEFFIAYILGN